MMNAHAIAIMSEWEEPTNLCGTLLMNLSKSSQPLQEMETWLETVLGRDNAAMATTTQKPENTQSARLGDPLSKYIQMLQVLGCSLLWNTCIWNVSEI